MYDEYKGRVYNNASHAYIYIRGGYNGIMLCMCIYILYIYYKRRKKGIGEQSIEEEEDACYNILLLLLLLLYIYIRAVAKDKNHFPEEPSIVRPLVVSASFSIFPNHADLTAVRTARSVHIIIISVG